MKAMEKPLHDFKNLPWKEFLEVYDKYSLKDYLYFQANISTGSIDFLQIMLNLEAFMDTSVVESIIAECLHLDPKLDRIVGGMDNLARAFLKFLKKDIKINAKVTGIVQTHHGVTAR